MERKKNIRNVLPLDEICILTLFTEYMFGKNENNVGKKNKKTCRSFNIK